MAYISVGNSISIRENKDNTISYYISFRDNNNKVKRKKIFTKSKHTQTNLKQAILLSDSIKENNIQEDKTITINFLSEKYFESRENKLIGSLRRKYSYLTEKEFNEDTNVKKKIIGLNSQKNTYTKNVSKYSISRKHINNISREDIKNYIDNELNLSGLSAKTVFNVVSMVKTIINFGIRNEYINNNPFINIQIKNPKRKRQRYLNFQELELLLKEAQKHQDPNVYMCIYLGVLTAARARSVLNIQKKDIDFNNGIIKLDNFKSDKIYTVKISDNGSKWLKKITKDLSLNDYLIHNYRKESTQKPFVNIPKGIINLMDELFNQGLNKQNNNDRDYVVNYHTIRRSVATNMALEGIDIYKIMTMLNHTSIKQTQDYLNLNNIIMTEEIENFHSKIFKNF